MLSAVKHPLHINGKTLCFAQSNSIILCQPRQTGKTKTTNN